MPEPFTQSTECFDYILIREWEPGIFADLQPDQRSVGAESIPEVCWIRPGGLEKVRRNGTDKELQRYRENWNNRNERFCSQHLFRYVPLRRLIIREFLNEHTPTSEIQDWRTS